MKTIVSREKAGEKEFNRSPYIKSIENKKLDRFGNAVGDGTEDVYFTFLGRVAEFNFLYPNGCIVTSPVESRCTTTTATIHCKVYRDVGDALPAATAIATRNIEEAADDYQKRFYECAETAAITRALRLIGIGIDFDNEDASFEGENTDAKETLVGTHAVEKEEDVNPPAEPQPAPVQEQEEVQPAITSRRKKAEKKVAEGVPAAADPVTDQSVQIPPDDDLPDMTDDEALNVIITSIKKSSTIYGKTFLEAIMISRSHDINAFISYLEKLKIKGTPEERKGAIVALRTIAAA